MSDTAHVKVQENTLLKLLISTKHQRQKTAKIKQEETTRWNRHEERKINKPRDKSKNLILRIKN